MHDGDHHHKSNSKNWEKENNNQQTVNKVTINRGKVSSSRSAVFNELEMSTHYSTFTSTPPTGTPLTGTAHGAHLRVFHSTTLDDSPAKGFELTVGYNYDSMVQVIRPDGTSSHWQFYSSSIFFPEGGSSQPNPNLTSNNDDSYNPNSRRHSNTGDNDDHSHIETDLRKTSGFTATFELLTSYVTNAIIELLNLPGLTNSSFGSGVGHHYFPMQILKELLNNGKISLDAFQVGSGIYSGPTNKPHHFGTYGGVSHDEYNKIIRRQVDDYMKHHGKSKLSKGDVEKLANNFANGMDWKGRHDKDLSKFNSAVNKQRIAHPGKKEFVPPTTNEAKNQGLKFIKENKGRLTPDQLAKFESRLKKMATNRAQLETNGLPKRSAANTLALFGLFNSSLKINGIIGSGSNLEQAVEELHKGNWVNFKHLMASETESFATDVHDAYGAGAARVIERGEFAKMIRRMLSELDEEAAFLFNENQTFWQNYEELELITGNNFPD